jgi:hypothetical protein
MADSSSSTARPPTATGGKASTGTNVLNQKFGPFPLWVYLLAVGIGLYALEKNKAKKTTTSMTGASQSTAAGAQGVPDTGAASQSAFESLLAANAGSPQTNPQWEANAESVLVGYGYPAVQVQSALNTYLAGGVLSSVQQEIVNAVIAAVGPPPSPPVTAPSSTASPPVAAPPTANPAPPSQAAPAPAASSYGGPGYGVISINGQQFIELGQAGKQLLYQVAGGAPVYFGDANGVSQGAEAEAYAAYHNQNVYTPIEFAPQVSATATQNL